MAKKTNARKSPKPTAKKAVKKADAGYRGHRKGTIKEKLHLIFDQTKKNPEKARELAMKLKDVAPGTITTSFSQFRNADK
jgi:hypothetical protein